MEMNILARVKCILLKKDNHLDIAADYITEDDLVVLPVLCDDVGPPLVDGITVIYLMPLISIPIIVLEMIASFSFV